MRRDIENWRVRPVAPIAIDADGLPVERVFGLTRCEFREVGNVARTVGPVAFELQLVHEDRMAPAGEEDERERRIGDRVESFILSPE